MKRMVMMTMFLQQDPQARHGKTTTLPSPDHLFQSALSHAGKKIVFDDNTPLPSAEASPPRKRKCTKHPSKDVLLGCAYIHHFLLHT